MKVIYEPNGRAKEYADLALNIYNGCGYGCEYCYAPQVMHKRKEDFFGHQTPRQYIIENLDKDLIELANNDDDREVLMCFSCDPYQEIDVKYKATRHTINLFNVWQRKYAILTKGGKRSERDFDLLVEHPELCRYGATLVFTDDEDCSKYEPDAAPTSERIEVLAEAHHRGIRTWVSIEPAWSWEDTKNLVLRTFGVVDEYRFGKLNYHPHAKEVDWVKYKKNVVELCESLDLNYNLKRDLSVL